MALRFTLLCAAASICGSQIAWAGRPLSSDDAGTAEAGSGAGTVWSLGFGWYGPRLP